MRFGLVTAELSGLALARLQLQIARNHTLMADLPLIFATALCLSRLDRLTASSPPFVTLVVGPPLLGSPAFRELPLSTAAAAYFQAPPRLHTEQL